MNRWIFISGVLVFVIILAGFILWFGFPRQSREVRVQVANQEPIEVFVHEPCPGAGEPRVEKLFTSLGDDLEKIKRRASQETPLRGCPVPVRYELYP